MSDKILKTKLTLLEIAIVAFAACNELNKVIGFPAHRDWDDTSDDVRENHIKGVEFAIANSNLTDAQHHDQWVKTKQLAGWKYGEELNRRKKEHPLLVKFEHLPPAIQAKTSIFRGVVRSLSDALETDKEQAARLRAEESARQLAEQSEAAENLEAGGETDVA
jgi:hypothetical protein